MKRLSLVFCAFAVATGLHGGVMDIFKFASKGSASSGPGSGQGGAMVVDILDDPFKILHTAVAENVTSLVEKSDKLETDKDAQTKAIQEAIGEASKGEHVDEYTWTVDALSLADRQRLLETLKADPQGDRHIALTSYLEATQAHEARTQIFNQRLNELIKINNETPLNWQQRVRLGAEIGLYQGQKTLAEMEMREVQNRALVAAEVELLEKAKAKNARVRRNAAAKYMMESGAQ